MSSVLNYEMSKDERAVIYNHVFEIQSQIPGMSPLNVSVEKSTDGVFQVSFSTIEGLSLESVGSGESVFEASQEAKNNMLRKLQSLVSTAPSPERALEIFSILHGSTLH